MTSPTVKAPRALVVGLAILLVLPLFVAVIGFHKPTWTPVLDLAQTEMRVRDVGTSHTPLIGLPGRIVYEGNQGSHPGPLSFYALAPVYRLFGSTAFALQMATFVLNAGAVIVALVLARRRGGTALVLGVGAVIAVLIAGFGVTTLTEPWNPYLPLLWWLVVLLAVWSVVAGDVAMLPVAVIAGCFCAQTHVPYLVLSLGAGAIAVGATIVYFRRGDRPRRRSILKWSGVAAGIGVLAWLPPLIDQAKHSPGNLSILINYFTKTPPAEPTLGLRDAVPYVLEHLDVFHLSVDQLAHPGLLVANDAHRHVVEWRGAVVLVLWLVAAVVAVRMRHHALMLLHGVAATALVLVTLSTSHIYGIVWYYLLLSIWTVALLMTIATVWTFAAAIAPRLSEDRARLASRVGLGLLVAVIAVFSARSLWVAPSASHSDAVVVEELGAVTPATAAGLPRDGRYFVAWDDAAYFGSPGEGLLNELDRRGFDVGSYEAIGPIITKHRVLDEADATGRVQLATGMWVDKWRALPNVKELAFVDPRDPQEQARFAQLHAEVVDLLHAQHLDDLTELLDKNLFAVSIDQRISPAVKSKVEEMLSLGVPMAVFLAPPGTHL